jgi:ABC-type multidrug transport system ATPase subunit
VVFYIGVFFCLDILILDDPLSAVDVHVGKFLFEECIQKYLKGKTIVLMTNNLQHLDKADNIIVMKNGVISAQVLKFCCLIRFFFFNFKCKGNLKELEAQGHDYSEFIISRREKKKSKKKKDDKKGDDGEEEVKLVAPIPEQGGVVVKYDEKKDLNSSSPIDEKSSVESLEVVEKEKIEKKIEEKPKIAHRVSLASLERGSAKDDDDATGRQLMTEEEYSTKSIPMRLYLQYLLDMMPAFLIIPYFFLTLISEGGATFSSYWLGVVGISFLFNRWNFI